MSTTLDEINWLIPWLDDDWPIAPIESILHYEPEPIAKQIAEAYWRDLQGFVLHEERRRDFLRTIMYEVEDQLKMLNLEGCVIGRMDHLTLELAAHGCRIQPGNIELMYGQGGPSNDQAGHL